MSTSDDHGDRKTDDGPDRSIAIPGYRPAASKGPRHRPPSVQRTEAAGRVRTTGSHRAVRTTGPNRSVGERTAGRPRVGEPRGVSAPPPDRNPVSRPVSTRRADAAPSSIPPPIGAPIGRRASVDRRGRAAAEAIETAPSTSSPPPQVGGPRGIDELQAEMARDDVRLMARQIARGGSVEVQPEPAAPARRAQSFDGLIKWRPYIAAALVVGALVAGGLPILSTSSARTEHAHLATAVQRAAQTAGNAAAAGEVSGWIGDRDLEALRTFYAEQKPRILETLQGSGFDDIEARDVSIRVDYGAATLVIGAQVEDGEGGTLVVTANLAGELVGRKPPPGGLGPAFEQQSGLLGIALAGAIALSGLLWLVPTVAGRRKP